MANSRYVAGVAYERRCKKKWEEAGWHVTRSAGSHGAYDLIAVHEGNGAVILAQCKVLETMAQAKRLVRDWVPALKSNDNYLQLLTIWVREEKTVVDTWA